jgi:cathepsin L
MALNYFSDFTPEELRARLGYKRVGGRWEQPSAEVASSFLQLQQSHQAGATHASQLASSVDWRPNLNSTKPVHQQGECGSCWAHAAVGALEAHLELAGTPVKNLSFQQLVDCAPNPKHCGGTGGCHGATTELAFEYARTHGIAHADSYKGKCDVIPSSMVRLRRFVRLPENKALPLMHAIATKGPVTVSVDATSWFSYSKGVFSGCDINATVGHAVLTVGYGKDAESGKDYWLIKNSWGPTWGEQGYIRLHRHGDGEYCGIDKKPKEGVYCDGSPPEVRVCGMCGVTSDSAYPVVASH